MSTVFPLLPDGPADALERRQLALWEDEGLFRKTLDATASGPRFVFYEGPPTANGKPGIHHVFSRTIKDLICRYHAMQGESVTRIAGWDTHGLPVELEVEKQLKISGKQDIEEFGVEKFNALCRESVFRYQSEWKSLSDRIAYWLDYDNPYVTCTNPYMETVWWLLQRLHQRGLLIRGHRVLPYCPRCGTVLSSHELAQGYEDITTSSVYVTFPLNDGSGRELLVWTTTPWTLLSNAAVAVNADLEYGEYPVGDRRVILATARAAMPSGPERGAPEFAGLKPLRTFPGKELVGLRYARPLELVDLPPGESRVVLAADFVSAEDGSGIVHLAPAFGSDDWNAGQKHGLAMVRPVAADGTFTGTNWPELEGRLVTDRETGKLIIQRLKAEGRLLLTREHRHSYPHCWRCQSPLIYYARDSWFVRTSAVKDRMLELNAGVDWNPDEIGKGRFGEWLANNVDWALSRDRYWGTPLPVWVCDNDPEHVTVIGSYDELARKWGRALPADFDPHKPFIDEYQWDCECGGTMRRSPEVIDAWFDSGSMPCAQWHYPFENADRFDAHFPADYICEGVDQTRGWFYSLLAISACAFDSAPYRHVIVNEQVLDAAGRKMSKSRGNVVNPWESIAQYGADAVRLYFLASSQVWLPKRFSTSAIPEVVGGFLNRLRNTYEFFARYATGPGEPDDAASGNLSDRWILSRLDATTELVRASWEGYDVTSGVRAVMDFVDQDLSNWYVRINRARFWAPDREADPAAVATLREVLITVSRLLAPATPFITDWIHRALTGESVHLAPFPQAGNRRNERLDLAMDAARRLSSLARAGREAVNLRVRQPVARLQVAVPEQVQGAEFDTLLELVRLEVNVKVVEVVHSDADLVRLRARPNFRSLGKRFGKRTPLVAQAASGLAPAQLRNLEQGRSARLEVEGEMVEFHPEDVAVERDVTTDWTVQSDGPFVAALDPNLTEELRREGTARELVHHIQRLRKDTGLAYTTRIALMLDGPEEILDAAREHEQFIQEETLARRIEFGGNGARDAELDVEVDGNTVRVGFQRLDDGRP